MPRQKKVKTSDSPNSLGTATTETYSGPVPTPEQIEAYLKSKAQNDLANDKAVASVPVQDLASILGQGIQQAIEQARPQKKNPFNRKVNTPWMPKDGKPKLKLKRKMYQHGLLIDPDKCTNEEIDLLNKIRPGLYCDNFIRVIRRRDKGVNIEWPIKTPDQRQRLSTQYGLRNLVEVLQRCIEEANNPKKSDFDLDTED